ncbi:MAG: type II toxin-antitoxin system Phd/YefM family antitoxin [Gammaproteobacteria bacterium]|nr:type II toxin-antitoxin system Phd/YefM family antitoxin [Gammaproteobacteria bacterium]
MRNIAAKEAKTHFGELLDNAQREPITIEKHGRAVAVVLSTQEYNEMKLMHLRAELAIGEAQADRGQFAENYSLEGLINELDNETKSS